MTQAGGRQGGFIVFSEEIKKLKGTSNVRIYSEKIAGKIAEWIPELKGIEKGRI